LAGPTDLVFWGASCAVGKSVSNPTGFVDSGVGQVAYATTGLAIQVYWKRYTGSGSTGTLSATVTSGNPIALAISHAEHS
jgi:hypothetical protein